MNTNDKLTVLDEEMRIDPVISDYLLTSAKWTKVTAITGFVISMVIFAFTYKYYTLLTSMRRLFYKQELTTEQILILLVYITAGIVHFILSLFQLQYANKIQAAINNNDQESLNSAFAQFRNFSLMRMIVAVVVVVLFLLAMVGMFEKNNSF
jgi:divalent metal cation (Fe/Co/Zn/Cd) transporter